MEKYYRSKSKNKLDDLSFQIIEWHAMDEECENDDSEVSDVSEVSDNYNKVENKKYVMRCFGVTSDGTSITCKITDFTPFYYIKVPDDFNKIKLTRFLSYLEDSWVLKKYKTNLLKSKCSLVKRKDLFGFRDNKEYLFIRLVFNSVTAMNKSKYIFKKPVSIQGVTSKALKYKLYESNFDPFMRYCHIQNILMAGWVKLPKQKYTITDSEATTGIEVSIYWKDVISLSETQDIANFLQASFDIECYSCDYTFPDPNKKIYDKKQGKEVYPNVIYQIATTFKYYKDKNTLVKHLLTLKSCEKINDPNSIVVECKDERELLLKWVDMISNMDPDILYSYNGDTFDWMYIHERAKLLNIDSKLKSRLSRLTDVPTDVKKETFSSSAYGDSDFVRFYIPGRLHYDLLIHYKRGMKKYPSYKLDYIANSILKEGKNEVSAKDIFSFYEDGSPDKIKCIGEYCVQDTLLLQRLVDTQLILITIIQLANVTFVPVGFLITRGQTIKVYSQLLRKARQMNFLIPHTNFNEDSYPITIKTKDPHHFDLEHIGEYIEINCGKSQVQGKQNQDVRITGKFSEIIDEETFVVLSDIEIMKEYYNISFKHKHSSFAIKRMFPSEDSFDDSFTGATVLTATPGIFTENISVLDFASLYPTVIISRNLCYSTFVKDSKFLNCKNVKYEHIAWDDTVEYKLRHTCEGVGKSGKSKGQVCGKQAYFDVNGHYYCRIHDPCKKTRDASEKFQKKEVSYEYTVVQPHTNEDGTVVNKGVLPAMLEELYAERKKVKKQMAIAKEQGNKLLAEILDSTQLAIKISLNSSYGFLGRRQGSLILKELGSIVTAVGRKLLVQSKTYAENEFINYLKNNKVLTQTIKYKDFNLPKQQKDIILNQFAIKK